MRIKIFSTLLLSLCVFLFSILAVWGQQIVIPASSDKSEVKTASPTPTPKATPAPTVLPSFMDQPDYKAFNVAIREKDPNKQITALEKYLVDFPNSALVSSVQSALLDAFIKVDPANKERIYQQALRAVSAIKTDTAFVYIPSIASSYNSIISSLYKAGMNDQAEEIAQKELTVIDQINAKQTFAGKYRAWITLGQIYLKKGYPKKAEQYFKQSMQGEYDGNAALLGLADIAEKKKKYKIALDYLMQADAKGNLNKDQRAKLEEFYVKHHGSTDGLSEILDENYKRANPLPITVAKYIPTAQRSRRTVLAELFTGSACHPCITADTAFEALLQRYNPSDVAVLIYDLHIPGPDPITNLATVARGKFYGTNSTPTYIINGVDKQTGGGINRKESKSIFDKLTPKIDAQLEKEIEADLQLSAKMENGVIKTNVNVENIKGDYTNLKVYIGLVENELSYMGENGIRFHPMVVRELGGENRTGFAIKDKTGNFEWQFDLQKVSGDLKAYIDKYEADQQKEDKDFAFTEKKYQVNDKNLSVFAFIQDEKTKNVLQSTFVDLAGNKK